MKQAAYLFTAGVTISEMRPAGVRGAQTLQTGDTCISAIIYGGDAGSAQKTFEDGCQGPQAIQDPVETEIKKIVGAELVDELLTESGGRPLDWPDISRRLAESALRIEIETETEEPTEAEDLGEGYWVDVNHAVPAETARLDVESLKRGLPEEIGSALNWSPDKQFLFLVSSLSAPTIVTELREEHEEADSDGAGDPAHGNARPALDESVALLPEMREKEAAALIEARNSVVAAWLWRKFAANTPLASNEILVNPCCRIAPAN